LIAQQRKFWNLIILSTETVMINILLFPWQMDNQNFALISKQESGVSLYDRKVFTFHLQ
jgi:hypothetical protein